MTLPFRLGWAVWWGAAASTGAGSSSATSCGRSSSASGSTASRGRINAVAPAPVTNREFTRKLGKVLGRPTLVPLPAVAVRLLLGEMGRALLLGSARVLPRRLERAGFHFRHPRLESALRAALSR
jgi:NAD dependent epimerase/dehydratase family enzyme